MIGSSDLRQSEGSRRLNLKIADALVAASAVPHQAALWTRTRKHYPMPDLSFYA
jgi:predicted nucleic acid-binding protein